MRTCLILVGVLLTSISPAQSQDVIVHKVGRGYLYIFPAVKTKANPAGVINVGDSITVMYSLRLIGRAKTRFIGMDASRTTGVSPRLTLMKKTHSTFGFFVRDTNQSTLEITIDPSFMRKMEKSAEKEIRGEIASEGNLNVTLWEKRRTIVIKDVRLE